MMKDCFGQLAHLKIRYNNSTRRHYLRVDEEKLKECDQCPLFNKCMFLKYNDIIRDLIEKVDEAAAEKNPKL